MSLFYFAKDIIPYHLVLDTCILCGEEKIDGDLVYAMFRVLLQELEDHYPELMKIVWE